MRVIVAGGRDFDDYQLLCARLDHLFQNLDKKKITIVSGKARGADSLGERYARERGYRIDSHPAKWNRKPDGSYDKRAGLDRNIEMAKNADAVVAFWDGKSTGTAHMIRTAEKYGLAVRVVDYGTDR